MKKGLPGILLLTTTVLAIILNFNSILQGRRPYLHECIVTLLHIFVWIFILLYAVRRKEYMPAFFTLFFWGGALITTMITMLINIFDLTINIMIPFVIVFLTPLYGVAIAGKSFIIALIVMIFIEVSFVSLGLWAIIRLRVRKDRWRRML